MNDSVVFRGLDREFSFLKFTQESTPAKPGVLCLAIFNEGQWQPLLFQQYSDLSAVDMNTLTKVFRQKHSELDASDVVVFLDVHDSNDSVNREAEVINLCQANGLDPLSISNFPLHANVNLKNADNLDVPVIFQGIGSEYSFFKFEPGNIPAKPGVLCLAVFYKGQWLPLQFEQHFDLSIVDMNALIETCSQKHSELDASNVAVLLDIHDSNDSLSRESEVINLCKANGLDQFSTSTIPLLADAKLKNSNVMNFPVIFQGKGSECRFKKFELGSIPSKPGVLCLAVYYKSQWLPLQFEQHYDLSKVDMKAMIESCSEKYSDLSASDVVILLDIHDSNDSLSRESEVINLCKANGLDPISTSTIPLLAGAKLRNSNVMDFPVTFQGKGSEYIFKKFELGNIPEKSGVLCLAVFHEGLWLPLQFEHHYNLSKVDMKELIESCIEKYSDLSASDVVILLDIHDSNDSLSRESEVINLCKANGLDPFSISTIPMQKTG